MEEKKRKRRKKEKAYLPGFPAPPPAQPASPRVPSTRKSSAARKSQDKAVSHPHQIKRRLRSPALVKHHCLPAQRCCRCWLAMLSPRSLPAFFSPPSAPAFKGTSAHLLGHQQECPSWGMRFDAFALLGKDVRHP